MPTGTLRPPRCARDRPSGGHRAASSERRRRRARRRPRRPRAATGPAGRPAAGPRPTAAARPRAAPAPGSARPPSSRPRPVTTIVLPAPVSPVTTVRPGAELEHGVVDHAEAPDPHLLEHGGDPTRTVGRNRSRRAGPRQPCTGRSNFATSRSVNGAACSRASRTGALAAADLDPGARRQLDSAPAVAPQHARRRARVEHLDGEHRVRRDHQRPGEQRVRADRHQQQRLDLRPDHRPAGRERVRRRAGRRGAARPRRSPSGTAAGRRSRRRTSSIRSRAGLLDRRLVQRPVRGRRRRRRRSPSRRGSSAPRPCRRRRRPGRRSRRGRPRSASARKPTWPRLTPSSGAPVGPGELGAAQQGAVAAEHDDQLAARRPRPRRRATTVDVGQVAAAPASSASTRDRDPGARRAAARRPAAERERLPAGRCARRAGRVALGRGPAMPPTPAHDGPARDGAPRSRAGSSGGASRRSQRKYSTLPAGPGSGLAVTPATPEPELLARRRGDLARPPRPAAPGRAPRRPRRAASRPTSNCGLTISTRSRVRRRARPPARAAPAAAR